MYYVGIDISKYKHDCYIINSHGEVIANDLVVKNDADGFSKLLSVLYSLKSLTRLRDALVRQRSFYLVKITNVLDHVFPEFKPFFGNKFSVTARKI